MLYFLVMAICPNQNFLAYAVGINMPYSKFLSLRRRHQYTLFCIYLLQAVVFLGLGSQFGAEHRVDQAIVVFFTTLVSDFFSYLRTSQKSYSHVYVRSCTVFLRCASVLVKYFRCAHLSDLCV